MPFWKAGLDWVNIVSSHSQYLVAKLSTTSTTLTMVSENEKPGSLKPSGGFGFGALRWNCKQSDNAKKLVNKKITE